MIGENDSAVKAVACEDAMAKPCLSFSFDENFKLDSDVSSSAIDINDAWSPVAMGGAEVNLDNRVSPLKLNRQGVDTGLLGGLFGQMTTSRRKPINRVQPAKVSENFETRASVEEAALAAAGDNIRVNVRIQYMKNAQDYLNSYKEKL